MRLSRSIIKRSAMRSRAMASNVEGNPLRISNETGPTSVASQKNGEAGHRTIGLANLRHVQLDDFKSLGANDATAIGTTGGEQDDSIHANAIGGVRLGGRNPHDSFAGEQFRRDGAVGKQQRVVIETGASAFEMKDGAERNLNYLKSKRLENGT